MVFLRLTFVYVLFVLDAILFANFNSILLKTRSIELNTLLIHVLTKNLNLPLTPQSTTFLFLHF